MKQLWLDANTEVPVLVDLPCGQAAVYSRPSPDKSSSNEDAALVIPLADDRAVFAVADGCGGMSAAADAAEITLKALRRAIRRSTKRSSLRSAILDGIETANSKVLKLGVGAATTLAVAEIVGDRMRAYHIGDSQIVMVGARGKIKLQTPSHSPVGYAVEAGVLSEEDAMTHEDRHIVSNVVGALDCRIEVSMGQKMARRDTLILASDGILDNLQVDEVCAIIRNGPLEAAASKLSSKTEERITSNADDSLGKPDDATFVIYRRR